MNVAGVTAAGLPGVVIGHNDQIAWGFTNVGPDVQDLYIEKFDPANPLRYMTPAGWRDAEVRHEQIKVRKSLVDVGTDVINYDVVVTRHGPIVFEKDSKRYALRWTGLDPKLNNPGGVYSLNRAGNWREFTNALRGYTPPMQNIVYADVSGHIGYYAAGVVPIRKSGDGSVPYDGATDDGEWVSFVPFEKLPQLYDPPSGMIVTANQRNNRQRLSTFSDALVGPALSRTSDLRSAQQNSETYRRFVSSDSRGHLLNCRRSVCPGGSEGIERTRRRAAGREAKTNSRGV